MRIAHGTVVSGRVVLEEPGFSDGTGVYVVSLDEPPETPSQEELAELDAGLAELDRGETLTADELFAMLGRYG